VRGAAFSSFRAVSLAGGDGYGFPDRAPPEVLVRLTPYGDFTGKALVPTTGGGAALVPWTRHDRGRFGTFSSGSGSQYAPTLTIPASAGALRRRSVAFRLGASPVTTVRMLELVVHPLRVAGPAADEGLPVGAEPPLSAHHSASEAGTWCSPSWRQRAHLRTCRVSAAMAGPGRPGEACCPLGDLLVIRADETQSTVSLCKWWVTRSSSR
jgi:hypothetical protein